MAIKVLTKEDLEDFKKELLEDIKGLFHSKVSGQKLGFAQQKFENCLTFHPARSETYESTGLFAIQKLAEQFIMIFRILKN